MDRYTLSEETYENVCLKCRQVELLIDSIPGVRSDLEATEHLDDEIGVDVSLTFRVGVVGPTDLPHELVAEIEKLADKVRGVIT